MTTAIDPKPTYARLESSHSNLSLTSSAGCLAAADKLRLVEGPASI